jgi:hypothetical protein
LRIKEQEQETLLIHSEHDDDDDDDDDDELHGRYAQINITYQRRVSDQSKFDECLLLFISACF